MNTEPNQQAFTDELPDEAGASCQNLSAKVDEAVSRTKAYVRQNPVPMMLGALTFGAALGYMIVLARREESTLRERIVEEPLHTAREAIYAVLAPVANRLYESYDSTRERAGKALDNLQHTQPGRTVDSWFDQLGRISSNLKFW